MCVAFVCKWATIGIPFHADCSAAPTTDERREGGTPRPATAAPLAVGRPMIGVVGSMAAENARINDAPNS